MIRNIAFQTKARTVDHLGREQIADTPTAISELWKNAFDAYSRNVSVDIFAGEEPIAVISDNGHGMNREEFESRWLVVGTESKATTDRTSKADRNGLSPRPRQGQKGIGRLSCANLGPVLLLVSKRKNSPFVAALLDWRLFENPFINLADIHIPVTEFEVKEQLFALLPELTEGLAENLNGGADEGRSKRLKAAWNAYDDLVAVEQESGVSNRILPPSEALTLTIDRIYFEPRHLAQWPVWTDQTSHGTALMVSELNYDLRVELDEQSADTSARAARDRFFETLTSFVDPFFDPAEAGSAASQIDFSYAVRSWNGTAPRLIVGDERQFDRRLLDGMEHQLIGSINTDGVFQGRVKAFGQWVQEACEIDPPKDLIIPKRADTGVGPFEIYIASMEFQQGNTTHPQMEFQRFRELADRYSGFMIFRDGLRVLPYGRTDNDFFEIESRRSLNAGREFWNHRQMFGRLAIRRDYNPNLKDKAGREGLLDNRAAKTLKAIVSNILRQSARRYFGSDSSIRENVLPKIQETNKEKKAGEARNKLRQRQRKEFRAKLQIISKELPKLNSEMEAFIQNFHIRHESEISGAQQSIEMFKERIADYRLAGAPKTLGPLEEAYSDYREQFRNANSLLATLLSELDEHIERISPAKPRELLEKQISRNAAQIHRRIQQWKKTVDELQRSEFQRIRTLVADLNKAFHADAIPILARLDRGELSYSDASKLIERIKENQDGDNAEIFIPYIGALEALRDSIDLEGLASFGMDELSDLRTELERLNSLAQLGIAVEIVGHELQSYDEIIGSGLRRLPEDVRHSKAAKDIELGYDGLTDQLRFLSPLRLAGQRLQKWISGAEIAEYISEFFKINLVKLGIELKVTPAFQAVRVYDQQARLLPVFINLVNNSVYWLSATDMADRCILLDRQGGDVIVSDNGPGIEAEDLGSLFSLFFTKKARGGRGVGLYLSRANLAAGGHKIRYEPDTSKTPLKGANFYIAFRGAE